MSPPHASGSVRLRAPLIGRSTQLAELEAALVRSLETSEPCIVTLLGAPGMGKSRLLREFLADVRTKFAHVRVHTGRARQGGGAYGAVRSLLRARLGLVEGQEAAEAVQTVRDAVVELMGERRIGEFLHFFCALLDLEFADSPFIQAVGEDTQSHRQIGRTVLRRFLELDARQAPLILALEDLHWADADSIDLLRYLGRTAQDAPILIVVTTRPEIVQQCPEWTEAGQRSVVVELNALDPEAASEMSRHLLAPTGEPPDDLVDAAVDLAGGNPYLLEQLVRTFHDDGVLTTRADGSWAVDLARLDEAQLPLSVDDAIRARIAALDPEERGVLEMAATLGGIFWLGALTALHRARRTPPDLWVEPDSDMASIREVLDDLIERDYLLSLPDSTIPGDAEYVFKHNLERESLSRYTSVALQSRYHVVIAQWLEARLSEQSEAHCELLAQHFERGEAPGRAARYYLLAGDRARQRYAAATAASYYERALALLGPGEGRTRLAALAHHGEVLQLDGKSDRAIDAFERMRRLAFELDLRGLAAQAHLAIGRVHRDLGRLAASMQHFDAAHSLYGSVSDRSGAARCLDAMGEVQVLRGNTGAAEHVLGEARAILRDLGEERLLARTHNNLGMVYRDSGRLDDALASFQEGRWLWRKLDDAQGVADSLTRMGVVQGQLGNDDEAVRLWKEALEVATGAGDRTREAIVLTCQGAAAYRAGDPVRGVELLKVAEDINKNFGDRMQLADTLRSLAKARLLSADLPGAHRDIERAIDIFERAQSKPQLGVALRTLAEIAGAGEWPDRPIALDADREFERSMHILEQIGNDIELARTCIAYAEFLGHRSAESSGGRSRALKADQLRRRAAELLAKRKGVSIRASRIPRQN